MAQPKIAFHDLVAKVQKGELTDAELKRYFIIDPGAGKPFDPHPVVDPGTVDVGPLAFMARNADALVRDAADVMQVRTVQRLAKTKVAKHWIVSEGDSWFKLPRAIMPETLVDALQVTYPIVNIAHWGDTLDDMVSKGEFWSYLQQDGIKVLMLSAGGNDVLGAGELHRFLNLFDVDHKQPSQAQYYLRPEFYANLTAIVSSLESLIVTVRRRAPGVTILQHGYDYAVPRPNGRWLGEPMLRQGLDPHWDAALCRAIVRIMIDEFNSRLAMLQSKHADAFRHVDLRGTVKTEDWFDELHPKTAATKRTARKFATALGKLSVSKPVAAKKGAKPTPMSLAVMQLMSAAA